MSEATTTSANAAETDRRLFRETDSSLQPAIQVSAGELLVWGLIATVAMLFAGFASAYLVRREGLDWVRLQLPGILRVNTVVLLASSVAIELARRAHRRGDVGAVKHWVQSGVTLSGVFLLGQLVAWRQLAAQGVFLPTNPYSSFFYMLTGMHGVHLLGGMLALGYLLWHLSRTNSGAPSASLLHGCSTFWHFLGGVWICLYVLLLFY
jgi:cytochrome c oxidase subunit 3